MRARSEITFHGLLVLALAGIVYVNLPHWKTIALSLVSAGVIYAAAYFSPLHWTLPRRRRHVPSFAVCFLGAFAVSFLTLDPADEISLRAGIAAASGAFALLYAAVKIGVPTHVGIVVNAESVSSHSRNGAPDAARGQAVARDMLDRGLFDVRKFRAPDAGVWPEHFVVAQEGSVTWFIVGRAGTKATIRFDQGFDPFTEPGGDASVFEGVVPAGSAGVIPAGPVVRPDRGAYTIELQTPGGPKRILVHGGESERKG
jgi:hypothetical protein